MDIPVVANPNPNSNSIQSPPPPPPSPAPPHTHPFAVKRPSLRVTTEFDSESQLFFHKISSKFFDGLAKLKVSFHNDKNGDILYPQIGFLTKHFTVQYDMDAKNALLSGSFNLAESLQVKATHDVKSGWIGEREYIHIGWSRNRLSMSCTRKNDKSIVSCISLGSVIQFKYHGQKEQQGVVSMIATIDPSYKLELSSTVPSLGLPKATLRFPHGEVSLEEKEIEDLNKALSVSGILKGQLLNGICTAMYKDHDLNLRYAFKDQEMSFIPSICLPSNALSVAFKRRFSPKDKLSYWYHFDSNAWSTVYKHAVGKDLKFKAGYDSEVRLGWASLWVGDEDGKAKSAPMKMKVQFMLQIPQDDVKSSAIMFRVKKRWDI